MKIAQVATSPGPGRTRDFRAVVFDLDGVLTDTAGVHRAAWKELFDEFLRDRKRRHAEGEDTSPFDAPRDYDRYIDGKPRFDGVRDFLASRGITLPEGAADDPQQAPSVRGLGHRKNVIFNRLLEKNGVHVFDSSIALAREARRLGAKTAVISSSRNCRPVLRAAGIEALFDVTKDGVDAARENIPGKPDPAIFLAATDELGVAPEDAMVLEDAIAGVQAGRAAHFGLVVGIDRTGNGEALRASGADIVVRDAGELLVHDGATGRVIAELPGALDQFESIVVRLREADHPPAVFLDYDGTLTPIVPRPEDAVLSEGMRDTVARLANRVSVAVISGRDLSDVRSRVGIEALAYAGSHGLDIAAPGNIRHELGGESARDLGEAERELSRIANDMPGAQMERKRYSIALHYRRVPEERRQELLDAFERVAEGHPTLRRGTGKLVRELRPDVDWHKGRAVEWLLRALGQEGAPVVYLGDDATDEDAFRMLESAKPRGIGILITAHMDDRDATTAASHTLRDQGEVREFIERLASIEFPEPPRDAAP